MMKKFTDLIRKPPNIKKVVGPTDENCLTEY